MTDQSLVKRRSRTRARRLRGLYEVTWQLAAGLAVATGLAAVAFSASTGVALALWLTFAGILTTSWTFVAMEREFDLRQVLTVGLQGGTALAAQVGLFWLLGWSALPVAMLVVGGSPPVARRWIPLLARRWPSLLEDSSLSESLDLVRRQGLVSVPVPDLEVTDELTDEDLCLAWRSSYVALGRAATVESRMRAVRVRATILNELARRHGSGVRAWLGSGARAAGDPYQYLRLTAVRRSEVTPGNETDARVDR